MHDAIVRRPTLVLLAANLLGSVWYLTAVSPSWAIPVERESGITSLRGPSSLIKPDNEFI